MLARLGSAPLAASLLFAASLHQGIEYADGSRKYHVVSTTSGTQSTPRGSANFETGFSQQLSVTLARRATDTVVAGLTVDSIAIKSSGAPPDVRKLIGSRITSLVSPTGKFYSATVPPGLPAELGQIVDGLSHFLPMFRSDLVTTKLWADTITGKELQQGMSVDRTSIYTYVVSGDTTIGGETALRIQRSTRVRAAGTGTMQGTAVQIETKSSGGGVFFLTPRGLFMGGNSADSLNLKITILARHEEINIRENQQTRIDVIR